MGGQIQDIQLDPPDPEAYTESVQAILDADLVIIGPGSLYTSILPNLLVKGIAEALRATSAFEIYVCNVATQPGETEGYTVAEHVMALEKYIGRGICQVVLANNAYPTLNAGVNTHYVCPVPPYHEILQRYEVRYTDLVDTEKPWRHDAQKLSAAILNLSQEERMGSNTASPIFTGIQ
ncbi:MAG: 2-phospho-L-lactate transferase CofD family protein [Taibaiella sp.]|nr:2-phospho-L-lactate transferase CofD family protein [Taibaiella sp.]